LAGDGSSIAASLVVLAWAGVAGVAGVVAGGRGGTLACTMAGAAGVGEATATVAEVATGIAVPLAMVLAIAGSTL
jgi:hypothetical protein